MGLQSDGDSPAKTFTANVAVSEQEENARWLFEVAATAVETFQNSVDDILMVCHYAVGGVS